MNGIKTFLSVAITLACSTAFSQVTVFVKKPVLNPGEATEILVTVERAIPGCVVHIIGIDVRNLVGFEDLAVPVPQSYPEGTPYIITIPIRAGQTLIGGGHFTIMAEVALPTEGLSITEVSPGQPCNGEVGTGHTEAERQIQWVAKGEFDAFEIVFYENPCGKHPESPTTPTTPTTPTPTTTPTTSNPSNPSNPPSPTSPTNPTTPSVPTSPSNPTPPGDTPVPGDTDTPTGDTAGDDDLPPLPPGWEWGPTGARWTGEHPPEPPALPAGWEWGPLYPRWTGTGQPASTQILGTSEIINPVASTGIDGTTDYSVILDITTYVDPGAAYVYQVYGVATGSDGNTTGVLSDEICDRFSPVDVLTGETVANNPCPTKQGCTLTSNWLKKTPIKVESPLNHFPKGDDLKIMIPGQCISFSILASDVDVLKQTCTGQEDCEEEEASIRRIGPIAHEVEYVWTMKGDGELKEVCDNTIFYSLPKSFRNGQTREATIDINLKNIAGKAEDDAISGKAKLKMTFIDSCKCVDVEITLEQPQEKKYDDDVKPQSGEYCLPRAPEWKKNADIKGSITVKPELCPGALTILKADFTDDDKLKIVCEAETCGIDDAELTLNDPLHFTWDDGGAGGAFPLGNKGACVLYQAPDVVKTVTIRARIKDSETQFTDQKSPEVKNSEIRQLLDLTAINVNERGKYSNITVGHAHKFTPVWTPRTAKVKKIIWEVDLGGPTGTVRKVLCDPDGMTMDEAALKFKSSANETGLQVSWAEHTHIHGIRSVSCQIIGEAGSCTDCCLCQDDAWEESDFLGRDDLEDNQFGLFFEKLENSDDGRIENLGTVRAHDEFGDRTRLHGRDIGNWFAHWSSTTYQTCQHNHALANPDPIVVYRGGESWLGLYEKNGNRISLSDKAAKKSKRTAWRGRVWVQGSNMQWIDTRTRTQPAYHLLGHQLCNKVFVHEMGHYISMTRNWRGNGEWTRAFGALSATDVSLGRTNLTSSQHIEVTLRPTGNYNGRRQNGIDCLQKYNATIRLFRGNGRNRRVFRTIQVANTWLTERASITWTGPRRNRVGTLKGRFEFNTVDRKHVFGGTVYEEFRRANDPDNDFVPNQIEDRIGTSWQHIGTHSNHARGSRTSASGLPQIPDQEFFADQHVFDNWNLVAPGQPERDWANPGAQTTPRYQ